MAACGSPDKKSHLAVFTMKDLELQMKYGGYHIADKFRGKYYWINALDSPRELATFMTICFLFPYFLIHHYQTSEHICML